MPCPRATAAQVPLSGLSYDNTVAFSDVDWRHVKFVEQFSEDRSTARWLMMSDVCKHCVNAPCLEVCPTGAIIRTEFDTVYIQEPACNGCRDCIAACPFGVIHVSASKHIAQKCTFCYDRLQNGLVPACAQACPTASIQFGPIDELRERAARRVEQLHAQGAEPGLTSTAPTTTILGGLNAFYLLMDTPETYGLPDRVVPKVPSRSLWPSSFKGIAASLAMGARGVPGLRAASARGGEGRGGGGPEPGRGGAMNRYVADPALARLHRLVLLPGGDRRGRLCPGLRWRTSSATRTTAAPRGSRTTSPSRWSTSAACS